jgi:hypothetical protein
MYVKSAATATIGVYNNENGAWRTETYLEVQ